MGIGEMAAIMYYNHKAERENQTASQLRNDFNRLVGKYNNLLDDHKALQKKEYWYVDEVNKRAANLTEYVQLAGTISDERFALRDEVSALKKNMASKDKLIARQQRWIDQQIVYNKQQKTVVDDKQETIDNLTGRNNLLENSLDQKEQELNQKKLIIDTIRWGMKHIPIEYRIKAAAETYVRNPIYSQAILNTDMPEKMKTDIEGYLKLTLLSGMGEKHEEVKGLYEQAKAEVRADIVEENKEYDKLIEIHEARVKEAIDRGEDSSLVPGIWDIKAELEQKQVSEAKTARADQKDNDEEESIRPGM